jgi:hypothetical protein
MIPFLKTSEFVADLRERHGWMKDEANRVRPRPPMTWFQERVFVDCWLMSLGGYAKEVEDDHIKLKPDNVKAPAAPPKTITAEQMKVLGTILSAIRGQYAEKIKAAHEAGNLELWEALRNERDEAESAASVAYQASLK